MQILAARVLPILISLAIGVGPVAIGSPMPTTRTEATTTTAPDSTTGTVDALTRLDGGEPPKDCCFGSSTISEGARYVTYTTRGKDPPGGQTNSIILQLDRATGSTLTVAAGDRSAYISSITPDGRFVLVQSDATDLVPGQVGGPRDVYQWDRESGVLTPVSAGPGDPPPSYFANGVGMTPDGRYVAFESNERLVEGMNSDHSNIFQWDRTTGELTAITDGDNSSRAQVEQVRGPTQGQPLSEDGRYVTFTSGATNLVDGTTSSGLYQWDRDTGTTVVAASGGRNFNIVSASPDGRFVTFQTRSPGVVPEATDTSNAAYQWDRETGIVSKVALGDATVYHASSDGQTVIVLSKSTDLVPGLEDGVNRLYRWDQATREIDRFTPTDDGLAADWNDDVSLVVLHRGSTNELLLWDVNQDTREVIAQGVDPAASTDATLSPDGTRVTWTQESSQDQGPLRGGRTILQWDRSSNEVIAAATPDGDLQLPAGQIYNGLDVSSTSADAGVFVATSTSVTNLAEGVPTPERNAYLWVRDASPQAPAAPWLDGVQPRNESVEVTWDPPVPNGSAPITGYRITATGSSEPPATVEVGPESSMTVIPGLVNGNRYDITIQAINGTGTSPTVRWYKLVTPGTVPGKPIINGAHPSDGAVELSIEPPANTGGNSIDWMEVTPWVDGVAQASISIQIWSTTLVIPDLTNGKTYTFTVRAGNNFGLGPASEPSNSVTPLPPGSTLVPLRPCRILDTRTGSGELLAVGSSRRVPVANVDGCAIPSDALAIEATITAVSPEDSGFLRAWPSNGSARTTFLNFAEHWSTSNTGTIAVGPDGIDLRAWGNDTHIVIDVQGYYRRQGSEPEGALFIPTTPCRVYDSRSQVAGPFAPREQRELDVIGLSECAIPDNAVSVETTITSVTPTGSGFLRAWPTGSSTPNATFLNYAPDRSTGNTGTVAIRPEADEQLALRNFGSTSHYVVDIQGWFVPTADAPPGTAFRPLEPCRILDTRLDQNPLGASEVRSVPIIGAGDCGVPDGAVAVEATITAVSPAGSGFLRAWPVGGPRATATFLNFAAGQGTTNTGTLAINPDGEDLNHLVLRNYGTASHYVIEVQGYFASP